MTMSDRKLTRVANIATFVLIAFALSWLGAMHRSAQAGEPDPTSMNSLPHRTAGLDPQSQDYWRKKFSAEGRCGGDVAEVIPYTDPSGKVIEFTIMCRPVKLVQGKVISTSP